MGPERLTAVHSWKREGTDLLVSFLSADGQGRTIRLGPKAAIELVPLLPHHPRTSETVTVLSSQANQTADGSTALVLGTQESGPIAFVVDQQAIDALRRDLAKCEEALNRGHGSA